MRWMRVLLPVLASAAIAAGTVALSRDPPEHPEKDQPSGTGDVPPKTPAEERTTFRSETVGDK